MHSFILLSIYPFVHIPLSQSTARLQAIPFVTQECISTFPACTSSSPPPLLSPPDGQDTDEDSDALPPCFSQLLCVALFNDCQYCSSLYTQQGLAECDLCVTTPQTIGAWAMGWMSSRFGSLTSSGLSIFHSVVMRGILCVRVCQLRSVRADVQYLCLRRVLRQCRGVGRAQRGRQAQCQ